MTATGNQEGAPKPYVVQLDGQATQRLIEEMIYEHLIDVVDWPRVRTMEMLLKRSFLDAASKPDDEKPTLDQLARVDRMASAIITAAWFRLIEDERRYMELSTLDDQGHADSGTDDVRGATEGQEDCDLCRQMAAFEATTRRSGRSRS